MRTATWRSRGHEFVTLLVAPGVLLAAGRPASRAVKPPATAALRAIGDLPGGRVQSEALGVSEDGRVVFGESASERSSDGAEAFRWTEKDGLRALGGAFPSPVRSQPRACAPDGKVLVGHSIGAGGMPIATIWADGSAPRSLGDLPGGGESSGALAVSADGAVVVGWGTSASGLEAARWVRGGPAEPLGDLPGGAFHSGAALKAGVAEAAGWKLLVANGVSGNGRVIVGGGVNPAGAMEGWIVTLGSK